MLKYSNNVYVTLQTSFSSTEVSTMLINPATGIYNTPFDCHSGHEGIVTLVDDAFNPSNLEIVRYRKLNTATYGFSLKTLERALESTSARTWPSGTIVYQAPTKRVLENIQLAYNAKNLITNGNMSVDQRLCGGYKTNAGYGLDHWFLEQNTGTGRLRFKQGVLASPWNPAFGLFNCLSVEVLTTDVTQSAGVYYHIGTRVEDRDMQVLNWGGSITGNSKQAQTATLAFWVKHNLAGTHHVAIANRGHTRHMVLPYNIASAAVWYHKSLTIPPPPAAVSDEWRVSGTTGLHIYWNLGPLSQTACTSAASVWVYDATYQKNFGYKDAANQMYTTATPIFELTGVTLYPGKQRIFADFEPFSITLQRCQRYYEKSYNYDVTPGSVMTAGYCHRFRLTGLGNLGHNFVNNAHFKVLKRTTPSFTIYSPDTGTSGVTRDYDATPGDIAPITTQIFQTHAYVISQNSAAASYNVDGGFHWVADAELT
jgi:hypothetical protein